MVQFVIINASSSSSESSSDLLPQPATTLPSTTASTASSDESSSSSSTSESVVTTTTTVAQHDEESAVLHVTSTLLANNNNGDVLQTDTHRICPLISFQPITKVLKSDPTGSQRYIGMFQLTYEFAGYLAAQHLNQRNNSIVPDLQQRMESSCPDLQFPYEMMDTQVNRLVALRQLQEVATRQVSEESTTYPPCGIIGGASSMVSLAMANLAGVYQIPQISGTSSAQILDDPDRAPYFARTYPTNQADAEAIVSFWQQAWGIDQFGLLYSRDIYGQGYGGNILEAAVARGMIVHSTAYEVDDHHESSTLNSIQEAIQFLQSTGVRYFFGILHHQSYKSVLEMAYDAGIMGHPGYTWILSDNTVEPTTTDFALNATSEWKIAQALHGTGVLLPGFDVHPVMAQIMQHDIANDAQLSKAFFESHHPRLQHYFQEGDNQINLTETPLLPSFYASLVYDAAMAIGLAACEQKEPYFTSESLLLGLRQQSFQGASGYVTFNNQTGTRDLIGLRYTITNIVMDNNRSDNDFIRFKATKSLAIEFPYNVTYFEPYVFADNTTNIPLPIPPIGQVNHNYIPLAVQIVAWIVMVGLIVSSTTCIGFAYHHRGSGYVKAAQPEFLMLMAGGCAVMSWAILPMSWQETLVESQTFLNFSCMSSLYLLSIGFVTSFSALFCKLYRVNKLLKEAARFRRIQVNVQDVLKTWIVLLGINLTLLVAWTIVDPLRWNRLPMEGHTDKFGRPTETYATCTSTNRTIEYIFWTLYFGTNFVPLLIANWESYKGRHYPQELNKTAGIAMSMLLLLEALLLGLPYLLVVTLAKNPTGVFVVKVILVVCVCASVLVPMFLPLWNDTYHQNSRQQQRRSIMSYHTKMSTQEFDAARTTNNNQAATTTGTNNNNRMEGTTTWQPKKRPFGRNSAISGLTTASQMSSSPFRANTSRMSGLTRSTNHSMMSSLRGSSHHHAPPPPQRWSNNNNHHHRSTTISGLSGGSSHNASSLGFSIRSSNHSRR